MILLEKQQTVNVPNFEDVRGEMTPIPGFSHEKYLAHCPSGHVYSFLTSKWIGLGRGTGDDNRYLLTKLVDDEGKSHSMYMSEIIMSSHMGVEKSWWRQQGLEVDHIDNLKSKDNSISNLRLVTSAENKKNARDRFWNKVRLSMDVANQIREEFKNITKGKVEWYKAKGKELGVSGRSIQNICLGNTYKEVN